MARVGQGAEAPGGVSRRATFHHGDLERAALDAAVALLEREGQAGLGLRAVAAAVGVNHRALYRRFASHEALLLAVASIGFDDLAGRVERSGGLPDMTAEARLARAFASFALERPHLHGLMYALPLRGLFRTEAPPGPALRRLTAAAAAALVPLTPDPGPARDREIRDRVVRVWGLAHGLSTLYATGALWAPGDAEAVDYIAGAAAALAPQPPGSR